ncbi:hypothetical protein Scep_027033 [Stephania cephalantha]|uniref:Uncharacterized protein n=1 Tax=Stephania cephalantha TaxID=152367 RepID=A0AAP0HR25_9MAGN
MAKTIAMVKSESEKTLPKDAASTSAVDGEASEDKRLGYLLGLTLSLLNLSIGMMII